MFCQKCGARINEGDLFCQNCGERIDGSEHRKSAVSESRSEGQEKKKTGTVKWVIAAVAAILVVGTIVTDFAAGDTGNQQSENKEQEEGAAAALELSRYADYTEEELLDELSMEKTESGCYPDDGHINFECVQGQVYLIRLSEGHDEDKQYSLFGIQLGDNAESAKEALSDRFDFAYTRTLETEQSDLYVEKSTGYSLVLDYDSDFRISRAAYILESSNTADWQTDDTAEGFVEEEIVDISDEQPEIASYEVIPGYTYESDQSNEDIGDFRLYMNLSYGEDDAIFVHGWGYENYELSENCFVDEIVYFVKEDEYVRVYESANGDFSFFESLEYGFYTAMSDYNYFTGDFYLVTE